MTRTNCARGMCERLETCADELCPEHPNQPWNQYGAGRPVTFHRKAPPLEQPQQNFTATEQAARILLWLIGALALAAVLYPLTPSFT